MGSAQEQFTVHMWRKMGAGEAETNHVTNISLGLLYNNANYSKAHR